LIKRMGKKAIQDYTDTWENMAPTSDFAKQFQAKYKKRVCCGGGKCAKDPTKCGFAAGSLLILGVLLPDSDREAKGW